MYKKEIIFFKLNGVVCIKCKERMLRTNVKNECYKNEL